MPESPASVPERAVHCCNLHDPYVGHGPRRYEGFPCQPVSTTRTDDRILAEIAKLGGGR